MEEKQRPAPYPKSDFAEGESILLFESKVDRSHVKCDIKKRDKYPNYDGYIEIVDDQSYPLGKLEVQVKTLTTGALVYYCELETIAYAQTTTLPLLLILADNIVKKVYWKHVDRTNGQLSDKGKSFIFRLTDSDLVTAENNYLGHWLNIVHDFQKKISRYDAVQKLIDLNKISLPPLTLDAETISYFQSFIDHINYSIFTRFECLYRHTYPGLWKLGVAVQNVDKGMSYSLFGIKRGTSELLVKEIDRKAQIDLFSAGFFFMHFSREKEKDPIRLADQFVFGQLKSLIESKEFDLNQLDLASEYAFGIFRRNYFMFGLKESNTFSVDEGLDGLLNYFPLWVSVSIAKFGYPTHLRFVDPVLLASYGSDSVQEKIDAMSPEDRKRNTRLDIYYHSKSLNLYLLYTCLLHLKAHDVSNIGPSLAVPDYSLVEGRGAFYISEPYSIETISEMINTFYKKRGDILEAFLKDNGFPSDFIPKQKYFLFIVPEVLKESGWGPHFGITEIFVDRENIPSDLLTDGFKVLPSNSQKVQAYDFFKNGFDYLGKKYPVRGWSSRLETTIFEDFPYQEYVYQVIAERIKELEK